MSDETVKIPTWGYDKKTGEAKLFELEPNKDGVVELPKGYSDAPGSQEADEGDQDGELEALKAEADKLGIQYANNISAATLAKRIKEAKEANEGK